MRNETDGVIDDMRERYTAVAVEIADALTALAKASAGAPSRARDAALAAIAHIAAVQERLSRETQRLPAAREERLALMHSVLQAQQGALAQLSVIIQQLAVPRTGRIAGGPAHPPPVPQSYQPATAEGSRVEVAPTVPVSRRVLANEFGPPPSPWSPPGRRPPRRERPKKRRKERRRERRRAARASSRPRRHVPVLLKAVASRSLVLVTILAGGLLVAYATFPRAGGQPEPATRHVELPTRPPDPATVLPVRTAEAAQEPERAALPPPSAPKEGTEQVMREAIGAGAPYPPLATVAETPRMTAESPLFGVPDSPASRPPSVQQDSAPEHPSNLVGAAAQQQLTLGRVDTSAAAPPHAASDGGFVAVLFTHKEQAKVKRAFFELQHHFPNVLLRRQGELQAVDMGEKGVWHRLIVVPPGSREQADAICQSLAAAGYDRCWVKAY